MSGHILLTIVALLYVLMAIDSALWWHKQRGLERRIDALEGQIPVAAPAPCEARTPQSGERE